MKSIIIIAKLSNKKLHSKIYPLTTVENVEKIYLVRNRPLRERKVININPPYIINKIVILSEIYRILSALFILITKKVNLIIGIQYKMHGIYAYILSKLSKIDYALMITGNPKKYQNNKFFTKVIRNASFVSVRGSSSLKYIDSIRTSQNKTTIIHNYYDFNNVNVKNLTFKDKKYDLIFIGSFKKVKRPDIAIDVIINLKEKLPNISVIMIGSGPLRKLCLQQASDAKVLNNIKFIKYTKDIDRFLDESKILLLTSQNEGLPMVIVEALSHSIPVVAHDTGDVTDVAKHDLNSIVIDRLDSKEFSDSILKLLTDRKYYHRLSNGTSIVKRQLKTLYSVDNIASNWEKMLS